MFPCTTHDLYVLRCSYLPFIIFHLVGRAQEVDIRKEKNKTFTTGILQYLIKQVLKRIEFNYLI